MAGNPSFDDHNFRGPGPRWRGASTDCPSLRGLQNGWFLVGKVPTVSMDDWGYPHLWNPPIYNLWLLWPAVRHGGFCPLEFDAKCPISCQMLQRLQKPIPRPWHNGWNCGGTDGVWIVLWFRVGKSWGHCLKNEISTTPLTSGPELFCGWFRRMQTQRKWHKHFANTLTNLFRFSLKKSTKHWFTTTIERQFTKTYKTYKLHISQPYQPLQTPRNSTDRATQPGPRSLHRGQAQRLRPQWCRCLGRPGSWICGQWGDKHGGLDGVDMICWYFVAENTCYIMIYLIYHDIGLRKYGDYGFLRVFYCH